MEKLDEKEIATTYKGKLCSMKKLSKLFEENGGCMISDSYEYIARCNYFSSKEFKTFGITDVLYYRWCCNDIKFHVCVYTKNGVIVHSKIFKHQKIYEGGRPSNYELQPTQQEIRIFRRIMDYITIM